MARTLPAATRSAKPPRVSSSGTVVSSKCAKYTSMWSLRRRRRESSTAARRLAGDRPGRAAALPTLVISTMPSRRPRRASHSPISVSDSPPDRPGAQAEYTSAVSMALKPSAVKRSSRAKVVSRSAVQPNTLPPKTSGAISRPVRPSGRLSMVSSPSVEKRAGAASAVTEGRQGGVQDDLRIHAAAGVVRGGTGHDHERQQVLLGPRRMAFAGVRRLRPLRQQPFAPGRRGFHRRGQPRVEGLRYRRVARIAVAAHVVEAHAAADEQDALVAQR